MSPPDDDESKVWDQIERDDDDLEKAEEQIDLTIECVSCHWDPMAVHFEDPSTGKSDE